MIFWENPSSLNGNTISTEFWVWNLSIRILMFSNLCIVPTVTVFPFNSLIQDKFQNSFSKRHKRTSPPQTAGHLSWVKVKFDLAGIQLRVFLLSSLILYIPLLMVSFLAYKPTVFA